MPLDTLESAVDGSGAALHLVTQHVERTGDPECLHADDEAHHRSECPDGRRCLGPIHAVIAHCQVTVQMAVQGHGSFRQAAPRCSRRAIRSL